LPQTQIQAQRTAKASTIDYSMLLPLIELPIDLIAVNHVSGNAGKRNMIE
jgi:hypothetical protein